MIMVIGQDFKVSYDPQSVAFDDPWDLFVHGVIDQWRGLLHLCQWDSICGHASSCPVCMASRSCLLCSLRFLMFKVLEDGCEQKAAKKAKGKGKEGVRLLTCSPSQFVSAQAQLLLVLGSFTGRQLVPRFRRLSLDDDRAVCWCGRRSTPALGHLSLIDRRENTYASFPVVCRLRGGGTGCCVGGVPGSRRFVGLPWHRP